MDRLDRISVMAIIGLVLGMIGVAIFHRSEARVVGPKAASFRFPQVAPQASEIRLQLKKIRALIENHSLKKAEALASQLLRQYPMEGEPRMLLGDVYMRGQRLTKALYAYRDAIDRNPDYLDKNTRDFQGKKLKHVVAEGISEIEKRSENEHDDQQLRKDKKLIYYLQRRIAGSCD